MGYPFLVHAIFTDPHDVKSVRYHKLDSAHAAFERMKEKGATFVALTIVADQKTIAIYRREDLWK